MRYGTLVLSTMAIVGLCQGMAAGETHYCTVKEHFDNGGYTYVRCREGGTDLWAAAMQTPLSVGEEISFPDSPPMFNFSSKSLNRTFPRIYFVPGFSHTSQTGWRAPAQAPPMTSEREPVTDQTDGQPPDKDATFSGVDENGTVVFSDDKSKVPGKKRAGTKKPSHKRDADDRPVNRTDLKLFGKQERVVIHALKGVLKVYCSGGLTEYRDMMLPKARPYFDQAVNISGAGAVVQELRGQCYPYFDAKRVTFGKGVPEIDTKIRTATVLFTSVDPKSADPSSAEEVEAVFGYDKQQWKFVSFSSITSSGSNAGVPGALNTTQR
ncbi:hypothetical protein L4X63_05940 [Geomonas sp. Red32]|uniref:hypothetical protein n=1 Tax=Geomonas sp. Red32 TaxID=2912856 RepID=UPI00202CE2C2|nr:hypothetical protein [Geomonas sp. Red32]MCM0081126.1 hypothetical protein [Geomonas sp. Red32]